MCYSVEGLLAQAAAPAWSAKKRYHSKSRLRIPAISTLRALMANIRHLGTDSPKVGKGHIARNDYLRFFARKRSSWLAKALRSLWLKDEGPPVSTPLPRRLSMKSRMLRRSRIVSGV